MWKNLITTRPCFRKKKSKAKIKGTTIFPSAIIEAVYAFKHVENFAIEVSLDEFNSDKLCLFVTNKFLHTSSLKEIKGFLKSKLLFTPEICVVENK